MPSPRTRPCCCGAARFSLASDCSAFNAELHAAGASGSASRCGTSSCRRWPPSRQSLCWRRQRSLHLRRRAERRPRQPAAARQPPGPSRARRATSGSRHGRGHHRWRLPPSDAALHPAGDSGVVDVRLRTAGAGRPWHVELHQRCHVVDAEWNAAGTGREHVERQHRFLPPAAAAAGRPTPMSPATAEFSTPGGAAGANGQRYARLLRQVMSGEPPLVTATARPAPAAPAAVAPSMSSCALSPPASNSMFSCSTKRCRRQRPLRQNVASDRDAFSRPGRRTLASTPRGGRSWRTSARASPGATRDSRDLTGPRGSAGLALPRFRRPSA